ncbi:KDGP aldolase [Spiroplasma sp. SV19]|uniref:2-dehydro-3-deoxy-phosphogluconate aldolase n=1 Tax=Spiroplasma sp. SV19 TaxID=2570468 RepID=UPI0024B85D1D|nr:KDGP aldolase [Spiroplasma sp. SV19]WHQ37450.1 oxo-acid lyase [Spiroplasma sp. SV19]
MLFIKDRVCINVLAKDIQNAQAIHQASGGHALIGVLAKDFATPQLAITYLEQFQAVVGDVASVGLGAGDPQQCYHVVKIASHINPQHVNQVFPVVGYTRGKVVRENCIINCLISPTGQPGMVKISTGPMSSNEAVAIVPVRTALIMAQEMKATSIKFFPMEGLKYRDEYQIVATECAKIGMWLEPTGGITLENYQEILQIALQANVKKVIPHIYSSIMDQDGYTKVEDVKKIIAITKELLEV